MRFCNRILIAFNMILVAGGFQVTASPARAEDPPSQQQIEEDRRTADEIVAAAKKAGQNGEALAAAMKARDRSAAEELIGQEINIGGNPTERSAESWTMKSRTGLTVIATKLVGTYDPKVRLEENTLCMWGKLKSVDLSTNTITLEDTELIYVDWMPALHPNEK